MTRPILISIIGAGTYVVCTVGALAIGAHVIPSWVFVPMGVFVGLMFGLTWHIARRAK